MPEPGSPWVANRQGSSCWLQKLEFRLRLKVSSPAEHTTHRPMIQGHQGLNACSSTRSAPLVEKSGRLAASPYADEEMCKVHPRAGTPASLCPPRRPRLLAMPAWEAGANPLQNTAFFSFLARRHCVNRPHRGVTCDYCWILHCPTRVVA
ncbi:hypothetical protein GQ53DRAFT_85891 [Thozetella sp. PMI_491]|nr:hypothetical protein GQ53DRAFT_85891 [Thozetella sp. PMI_491]